VVDFGVFLLTWRPGRGKVANENLLPWCSAQHCLGGKIQWHDPRPAARLAERPITSSIALLNGQYATDYNLIAAASIMIALPTLAVYLALQKHFISGLTLGATKG
jgi:hypothetical protein